MKYLSFIPAFALMAFTTAQPLAAMDNEAAAAAARKIFTDHQDAVVWLSVVCKISITTEGSEGMNIPDREQKLEALGTVISNDGLIVSALAGVDPARAINEMGSMGRGARGKINATT